MSLGDLPAVELKQELAAGRLRLRTGPFVTAITSHLPEVRDGLRQLYADHPLAPDDAFADFVIRVDRPRGLRRWLRPQVLFEFDREPPFAPLPADQGFPLFEWGMNWCVSSLGHQYLTLHAAVLERDGRALILPAPSGSGKSTLCAGLAFNRWRLLSDELTVIDPADLSVVPVPRPISLKNDSIELIQRFVPGVRFGPIVDETGKGRVGHCKPPLDAVLRAGERPRPQWLVLPRYRPGAEARLEPMAKARAMMHVVDCAFNIKIHRHRGFELLSRLVERSDCYEFTYSRLEDAVEIFDALAGQAAT